MFCTAIIGLCASLYGTPPAIQGYPSAYDGDTLYFGSQSVRLYGIDAEEMDEPNGKAARDALRLLLKNSLTVRSFPQGDPSHGRPVAHCYTSNNVSLNAAMVSMGKALDCPRYSRGEFARFEPANIRSKLKQKPYCNPNGQRTVSHGR